MTTKRTHPKTDAIVIEFANGETETIRHLSQFSANILFENAIKRPIFVTQTTRINGEVWQRNDQADWVKLS